MENKRVAIIGSGTAGAASALFLARGGHKVTLFEKIKQPAAVGAGVMMQPSGMRVLRELGLEEEILQAGARVERLHATTPTGRMVLDLRYEKLDKNYYGLGLHRGALFQALYGAVLSEGIEVEVGVEVERVEESDSGVCALVAAFKLYEKNRRPQTRYYQWATRFLTPFFQSNSRVLGWLRDSFMGLACRIPLFARLMTSTMCGLRNGLLSSTKQVGESSEDSRGSL